MSMNVSERSDLMEKWAFEKNEALGISPYQITTGSGKMVWWRCSAKHHLFQRPVTKEATRNLQCPICKEENQKYLSERRDLMEKWAFEENEALGILPHQITAGSNKKVWWRCSAKHHLYLRTISKEATRNPQCPVCKEENQKYLSDYPELLKEFAYELNDISPEELTEGSDTRVKWRCKKHGHVWVTAPYHRIKEKTGCPYCSNKKVLQGFNDLLTVNPPNLRYWDYDKNDKEGILASNYTPASKQNAWWLCDKGHHTYNSIVNVINRKTACFECMEDKKQASADAVARIKKRQEVYAKRRERVKARQEFIMLAKQKALLEKQKRYITIIEPFWDYDENQKKGFKLENVSLQRVYCWKCSNGHKWKADLGSILNNPKCPECTIEENSISKKYPYLADVYDTEMNGGIPPEKCLALDAKYSWWTCRKGHTFIATIASAAKHKERGCMYCDKEKSFYSL